MSLQPRRPGAEASSGGRRSPTRRGPQPSSFLPRGPRELRRLPEPARKLTHRRPSAKARSGRASACHRGSEGDTVGGGSGDVRSAEPRLPPRAREQGPALRVPEPPSRFSFPVSRTSSRKQKPPAHARVLLPEKFRNNRDERESCSLDVFPLRLLSRKPWRLQHQTLFPEIIFPLQSVS